MHIECIAGGAAHQLVVHLVAGKRLCPLQLLFFLAHGCPHIGNHQVSAVCSTQRVVFYPDPVGVVRNQAGIGFESGRACYAQFEIKLPGGINIGLTHIVAVTDPAHALASDAAAVFYPGLDVCQQLAGVIVVSQAIDNRNAGAGSEALHDIVTKGSNHYDIDHGGDNPGAVLNRLAPAKLGVLRRQEHGVAA